MKEDINQTKTTAPEIDAEKIKIEWGETSPQKLTWDEALDWCKEQGGRLPTKEELEKASEHQIPGFKKETYWCNEEFSTYNNDKKGSAHLTDFSHGAHFVSEKNFKHFCRFVRDII